jgi:hypothetical protein
VTVRSRAHRRLRFVGNVDPAPDLTSLLPVFTSLYVSSSLFISTVEFILLLANDSSHTIMNPTARPMLGASLGCIRTRPKFIDSYLVGSCSILKTEAKGLRCPSSSTPLFPFPRSCRQRLGVTSLFPYSARSSAIRLLHTGSCLSTSHLLASLRNFRVLALHDNRRLHLAYPTRLQSHVLSRPLQFLAASDLLQCCRSSTDGGFEAGCVASPVFAQHCSLPLLPSAVLPRALRGVDVPRRCLSCFVQCLSGPFARVE